MSEKKFQPFVAPETTMAEFTVKSVLVGAVFGIIFGAATVYLALKAGLTVDAPKIIPNNEPSKMDFKVNSATLSVAEI